MNFDKTAGLAMAVDTSGRFGSVALGSGDQILVSRTFSGMLRHSAELFAAIQALLEEIGHAPGDIQEVYLTAGPGSFTGLRIGVTLAKMLHFANRTRVVALSTLDVLAENTRDFLREEGEACQHTAAILDAKRGQFFVAVYDWTEKKPDKILPDSLMTAESFLQKYGGQDLPVYVLGEGLVYYKDRFQSGGIRIMNSRYWYPHAHHLYRLGRNHALLGKYADPVGLIPNYLRGPDAIEKAGRIPKG
jgi:tRNA threonylcarbamoyladenosine biosynthesis protein TsaB